MYSGESVAFMNPTELQFTVSVQSDQLRAVRREIELRSH